MGAVEESSKEAKKQQHNEDEDVSSPKNLDMVAKRRRQNREAQRAFRERRANRMQKLERSMSILQDMVTTWHKKYNDLKLQYEEQTVELNRLKLRLQNGHGAFAVSDFSNKDMDKSSKQSLYRSASPFNNFITTTPPLPAPAIVTSRSTEELHPMDTFQRIKKYMVGNKSPSRSISQSLNREPYRGSVVPSLGVSKPLHLREHTKDNLTEFMSIRGNNNYNSLLYMLDSISKKSVVLPILNQQENNEVVGKNETSSSSVALQ